jgi:hypothetical protein
VHLVDMNRDEALDIAVGVRVDSGGPELFSYQLLIGNGDGHGQFTWTLALSLKAGLLPGICQEEPVPLAVGDLDRDCFPDFIDPCRILLSGRAAVPGPCPNPLPSDGSAPQPVFNGGRHRGPRWGRAPRRRRRVRGQLGPLLLPWHRHRGAQLRQDPDAP